jgi:DNA-binding response OmpR family regulator
MNRNIEPMLVEDRPTQAQFLEDILVQNHCGVSVAHSGEEALACRLRAANPHLPVIFITASKRPNFRQRAQELGAAGFFEKPFDTDELLTAIRTVLNP